MNLPELGVRRPVLTAMVFIAVISLGLVALSFLKLDLMPKIEIPSLAIITTYEGAGVREIETRVTKIIEQRAGSVSNVDKVESISSEGMSVVTLKFKWGADLNAAANEVRDRLDLAKMLLPEEVDNPFLVKFDLSMMPVIIMSARAKESYGKLNKLLEDKVADPLRRLPGVATVVLNGGLERQILVNVDRQKLEAYGLTLDRLVNILRAENLSNPGGHLQAGQTDYIVRVPEEYSSMDQIRDTLVGMSSSGAPIYFKDIAEVKDDYKEQTMLVQMDRQPGVMLMVQKQSDANTIEVSDAILKEIKKIQKDLPADVKINLIMDNADMVRKTIKTVTDAIGLGILLVILVIFVFLRNIRSSIIVAVSIPTSIIVTFLAMYVLDYTLNMISLISIAIAIGLVVDDSIVVLENIYRHRERGERPKEGAIAAAGEVGNAVISATLSTIAIFVPIIFVGGISGIFFKQLAVVISLSLLASLFTSLLLIPMLASKLVKVRDRETKRNVLDTVYGFSEKVINKIESVYVTFLGWALGHKKTVVIGSLTIFLASFAIVPFLGVEFMPEQDPGFLQIFVEMPVGTRLEKTEQVVNDVEKILLQEVPEKTALISNWGYGGDPIGAALLGNEEGTHLATVAAKLKDKAERRRSAADICDDLRKKIADKYPGAVLRFSAVDPMASIMFGGATLSVEVRGFDLEIGKQLAQQVAEILKNTKGVRDVNISRKEGRPELRVAIDRKKASALGLNIYTISKTVETAIDGTVATWYRDAGDEYDVLVRFRPEDRQNVEAIGNIMITSPVTGQSIRLSNIAHVYTDVGPTRIERLNRERIIKITGTIYGRDLGSVVKDAQAQINKIDPQGFTIFFGGAKEEQEKDFRLLGMALILGILLVYMVMAAQFESLRDPFIMLFAIPFAMMGVVWTLFFTGNTLSVNSFLGIIMLVGIVAKNGILLVDYINTLRRRGYPLSQAVQEGGRVRFRPVLMTALAAAFGLLPMALTREEGSEFWNAMSSTVIGGLMVSTVVTLIFAPTLYSIFEERLERKKKAQEAAAPKENP